MKLLKLSICVVVILFILTTIVMYEIAMASDTDGAIYKTTLQISNNSTALSNQAVAVGLSSTDMITAETINATANDCALLTGTGGSDIAFMPGYGTNPWITFVSSIGTSSTANQYLYSTRVTGGEIRYFPDDSGMTISDDATLEGGDDFSVNATGILLSDDLYIYKEDATAVRYNSGILAAGLGSTTAVGDNYSMATDDNSSWLLSDRYIGQTITPSSDLLVNSIEIYGAEAGTPGNVTVSIEYTTGGLPNGTALASVTQSANGWGAGLAWRVFTFDTPAALLSGTQYAITANGTGTGAESDSAYWKLDSTAPTYTGGSYCSNIDDAGWTATTTNDFLFKVNSASTLVSAACATGEYDIAASANTTHWNLYIDGVLEDSTLLSGASMPDNANDWTVKALYLYQFDIDVADTNMCKIRWEYDTTFTDLSGNGNDATPSFRTTSSDASLTSDVLSMVGLLTASIPVSSSEGGWTMVTDALAEPGNLFTQSATPTYGIGEIDYGELISDAADRAGQDPTNWHYIVAFGAAIGAAIFTFAKTHSTRMGRRGSLFLACTVAELVLVIFYLWSAISGLALVPCGILMVALIIWKKSPSPVD